MNQDFLQQQFYGSPEGKKILKCIQCGTCSGSCPLSGEMDHGPREIFALIRDGEMESVLRSDTPWFCVSCYQCMVRCPQEIPVADLMYRIKQMAVANGLQPPSHKLPHLYRAFRQLLEKQGRISESVLMSIYGLRHPKDVLANVPVALQLLKKKRMEVFPQHIRNREVMAHLLDKEAEK